MHKKRLHPTYFDYQSIYFSNSSDSEDPQIAIESIQDQPYFNVDDAMRDAYHKNECKIRSESIRPIAPGIYVNYNSLNILVGNQGKGKTHIMLRDIIQISRLQKANLGETSGHNPFHLIVYVSKNGSINDSTFEAQQELIQLPIHVVSDSNAEKYLKELDLWKELYDRVCESLGTEFVAGSCKASDKQRQQTSLYESSLLTTGNKFTPGISSEKLQQMFEFLHINKLGKPDEPLNTIILCEDFVKSKLLKSAYFTNYFTQLRHKHSIIYINVQFFKSIPTDYKNNCTTFFIFSGFSRQKLGYIYQQVLMPIDFEELWARYRVQKNHDFILINTRTNSINFVSF